MANLEQMVGAMKNKNIKRPRECYWCGAILARAEMLKEPRSGQWLCPHCRECFTPHHKIY